MEFHLPKYLHPDFTALGLDTAPDAKTAIVDMDGVAPEGYHSTSMYPEYFKIAGKWILANQSRMDSSVVVCPEGSLAVVENRNLKKGDRVILGRTEHGEEGIFVHTHGFITPEEAEILEKLGAHTVSLGPRILRTETAGLVSLATLLYEWNEMQC